jgi:beta-lactamase regulating signal transducer with metallopeptidase domain
MMALIAIPLASVKLPEWDVPVESAPIAAPLFSPLPVHLGPVLREHSVQRESVAPASGQQTIPFDWDQAAARVWLVGFLTLLAATVVGLVRVRLIIRSGTPMHVPSDIVAGASVLLCPRLSVPATAGFLKPVILLPAEAVHWSSSRLRMVIAHESAHVKRRDWFWQLVAQLGCAIHFFNPVAWMAARRLRSESELACDDFVLAQGIEPADYAQELLDIARRARLHMTAAVCMASSCRVEGRLRSIVDRKAKRNWVRGWTLVGTLTLAVAVTVPVAILHAVPAAILGRTAHGAYPKWARLPAIPWTQSKQVWPNVFLAENNVAGLPNGCSVRLVGVSQDDGTSFFWRPDGGALPDDRKWRIGGTYWQGNVFQRFRHGNSVPDSYLRGFVVEIASKTDSTVATTGRLVSPMLTAEDRGRNNDDERIPDVDLPAKDPAYAIVVFGVPRATHQRTGVLRFGIASQGWKTVADVANPFQSLPGGTAKQKVNGEPSDACGFSLGPVPNVFYTDSSGSNHQQELVTEPVPSDVATRLVLYDGSGAVIEQPDTPKYSDDGYKGLWFAADRFQRISRIVLQTCPYQWAEFRDVQLKPDFTEGRAKRLESGIFGTATGIAPGFSKPLRNGVTVSVLSITKAAKDGGNWTFTGQPAWRADGRLLRARPHLPDSEMSPDTWGKDPTYHIEIGYAGRTSDANTVVRATDVDPSFWLKDDYPSSQPRLDSLTTEFERGRPRCRIRVGVANGPWTTLASHRIDVPELPSVVGRPDPMNANGTGVSLQLGEKPQLFVLSSRKAYYFVQKPLAGVAERFVAVLKTGGTRVLTPCASGAKGLECISLPARHGEWSEVYNHLLASQVGEIQLQTRPYEWAEFPGVALEHQ